MIRRHFLGCLFVFLFLAPAWSVMFAQAQGGSVNAFTSGLAEETVTISSGTHGAIGLTLERNTTVTSASFFIKPTTGSNSPGVVNFDANGDGEYEWSFNQTGYGNLGEQNQFTSGQPTATLPISPNSFNGNPTSPSIYVPYGATVTSASIGVGFSPDLTGGFFPTGFIHDAEVGDVNGDGNDDFVLFSKTANLSSTGSGNGSNSTASPTSTGPAFRIVSHNPTAGIQFSSWIPTCANVTKTMVADINGDGYDDVINYASTDRKICMHFVNSATGPTFQAPVNVTHSNTIRDLDFIDFTGNGAAEMVSIRDSGKVSIDDFSNRTNTFSNRDSLTIYLTGTQTAATLNHMLLDYFNGSSNPPTLIAVDTNNDGTEVFWTSNAVVAATTVISGISSDAIAGDFDMDGDLDILSSTSTGHRSIEQRMSGWDGDSHNTIIDLTNATILDYDYNMDAQLVIPAQVSVDGNPATFEGNLSLHNFTSTQQSQNRVRGQTSGVLEPWTAPRALFVGDLDGDGFVEHLVLSGEGQQHGVFISAWHRIGYDVDQNGQVDFSAGGYAGNGSNGLGMLSVQDLDGNLTGMLNVLAPGRNSTSDSYGIQMSEVNFSMHSLVEGVFTFSDVEVTYLANFLVDRNPHLSGNLTNVLNQLMTGGTGALAVPFTFNTTQDGQFTLHTLTVNYQDGAPNIALPPTPILRLGDVQSDRVMLEWQNLTDFGDDLLDFAVYRSAKGQPVDTTDVYASTVANSTIDMDVRPGESWTYWVRSVHTFGVTSNLSQPFSVDIPYPLPKSYVPNVTAVDVEGDQGGALSVSWDRGDYSIVKYRIYLLNSEFTSIETRNTTLTTDGNTFTIETREDSQGQALVDGLPYYVAVVGFDQYGNASSNVTAVGPVYTRNNTALTTTLDVTYTGFAEEPTVPYLLLTRQGALTVEAHLHQDGRALANQTLLLHVIGDGEQYNATTMTNATGHAVFDISQLSSLGPIQAVGPMQLKVAFAGMDSDMTTQPLAGTSNQTDAYGTIPVTLSGGDMIELDDQERFDTVFTVSVPDVTHESELANLQVIWEAVSSDGLKADSGTAEVRGNELALFGQGVYDGELTVYFDSNPPTFHTEGMAVTFNLESAPDVENNETNTNTNQTNETTDPTFPTTTLAGTLDCGDPVTYGWEENATDVTVTCVLTNPNPFDATVEFTWKVIPGTPPPVELVWNQAGDTSLTVEANGSVDLTFRFVRNAPTEGMFPGEQGEGYTVRLTCLDDGDNACDTMTEPSASSDGQLVWILGEMPMVDDGKTNDLQDQAESAMTPVVVGIGLVIAILAAIVGVLYMRRNMDDFDDDEDEEDYYEMAMDQPASRSETLNLGSSKSLDELKDSGKSITEEAPEGLAASPTLGSSADAFEFGATAEDAVALEEDETSEGEYDEEADDGITVDENGTEWWEDEDGVWWYREEGWDDWAVWEE